MNEIPSTGRDSLPLSGQRLLEAPCLRFEDAWKAGQTPQVEAFLGGAAGLHRAALLKELVRLDVVYRRRRGESVSSAEYLGRFPDLDATWLERELMPATLDDPRAAGLGETLSLVKPPVAANRLASAPGDSIQVPGYEVLGELGRGGMGVVYLARNVVLDRREVLKVVNQKLLGDPAVAERFLREMRAAAKLSHENVVKAHRTRRPANRWFLRWNMSREKTWRNWCSARGRCRSRTPAITPRRRRWGCNTPTSRCWSTATSSRKT